MDELEELDDVELDDADESLDELVEDVDVESEETLVTTTTSSSDFASSFWDTTMRRVASPWLPSIFTTVPMSRPRV